MYRFIQLRNRSKKHLNVFQGLQNLQIPILSIYSVQPPQLLINWDILFHNIYASSTRTPYILQGPIITTIRSLKPKNKLQFFILLQKKIVFLHAWEQFLESLF